MFVCVCVPQYVCAQDSTVHIYNDDCEAINPYNRRSSGTIKHRLCGPWRTAFDVRRANAHTHSHTHTHQQTHRHMHSSPNTTRSNNYFKII